MCKKMIDKIYQSISFIANEIKLIIIFNLKKANNFIINFYLFFKKENKFYHIL